MNVAFKEPAQPVRSLNSIAEALLLPTGIDGIYRAPTVFETVVDGLSALISRYCEANTEVLRFPPVMSRASLEKRAISKAFRNCRRRQLPGRRRREIMIRASATTPARSWTEALAAADLVLSAAACYPVYPLVASRGHVPAAG